MAVAEEVLAAEQHLEPRVGKQLTERTQALPGILVEEADAGVEGGAAPAFDREQARQVGGIGRRRLDHVERPHPGGEQRLVRVAQRRVGQQHLWLLEHPLRDALGAELLEGIIDERPRSKLAKAARNKLKLTGHLDE